ncbi:MAG: uracil-DNA glycosylase, partial [Calditrichaeota bacterium]
MDAIIYKIYQLFSQEIELYGNELALGPVAAAEDQQTTLQSVNWQQASSLEELADQIHTCTLCQLSKSRNKFVFGVGNPHADMMVIGEAPGADEDRIGEPFVGKAGELLDKMLAAISLNRETVYIANILKCRPPQNRDPLPNEMQLCKPYLLKQIELSSPKIILCLGRIAAHALLETTEPLAA